MTSTDVIALAPRELLMQTAPDKPQIGGALIAGLVILGLFFGVIGSWSTFAPLSSAVVADGLVKVAGNRKTVQHLEGGIIRDLLVKNGDAVEVNDVLMRLEDAQSRATWELIRIKYLSLQALEARLIAERERSEQISFPRELLVLRNSEQVLELLIGQETIFASRRRRIEGEVEILHRRVGSLTAEIRSYRAQERAAINQLSLLHEEIVPLERLVAKQISPKPKLLQLKRQAAHFGGVRDQQRGLIARAEQLVEETKLKMIDVRNKRLDEIVSALSDAQTQLGQYRERLVAAHDVLERRDIVSPIDGIVVNVQYFTPGGVVAPGSAIMDIVPRNDDLIIETRIKPVDVDAIEVGLLAEVRFTAFKQRTTPTLSGEVVYVSADILTDPEIEEAYFIARTKISAEELVRLDGLKITPGMPAQVMIIGDERTLLEYLSDPIRQSLRRAFREQ